MIENDKLYGLQKKTINTIQQALSCFPSIASVTLYGSRAKGNYRPGSDIDLTIKTTGEVENNLLFKVIGALDDLDLAYGFDVSILDSIDNENLIEHIQRVGIEFYNAVTFAKEQLHEQERKKQVDLFNKVVIDLLAIVPTPDDVGQLTSEHDLMSFICSFRQLLHTLKTLESFAEFNWEDLNLGKLGFKAYCNKYIYLYEHAKSNKEDGTSIFEEVDFELELIHRDEINVAYILKLLADLYRKKQEEAEQEEYEEAKKSIIDILGKETQLRSKRDLIEQFINEYLPNLPAESEIEDEFTNYWIEQKEIALTKLCKEEKLDRNTVITMIESYNFSGKEPLRETVFAALQTKPKVLERKKIFERILSKLREIITIFDN